MGRKHLTDFVKTELYKIIGNSWKRFIIKRLMSCDQLHEHSIDLVLLLQ